VISMLDVAVLYFMTITVIVVKKHSGLKQGNLHTTKKAKIKKGDITFAVHLQNIVVVLKYVCASYTLFKLSFCTVSTTIYVMLLLVSRFDLCEICSTSVGGNCRLCA